MVEYLSINLEDLYNEIRERRETQGLLTREQWYELIDEVLEEKREVGELDDAFEFEQTRKELRGRWEGIDEEET